MHLINRRFVSFFGGGGHYYKMWGIYEKVVLVLKVPLKYFKEAFNVAKCNLGKFKLQASRVLKCDVIKMKFLKLWDLSGYSERTISKRPTCQK